MARMIPAVIDPDRSPPGEVTVFRLLRDETPESWTVLHSLDLPRHQHQIEGEMDFLILVPGRAAICLEIKSHEMVRRDSSGMWFLGAGEPSSRSPFKQASEAMHSLRNRLSLNNEIAKVPFVSAVGFPRCRFGVPAIEWEPWQVFDEQTLRTKSMMGIIESMANSYREKLMRTPNARWFDDKQGLPSPEQCDAVVRLLRGEFERHRSPKARREEAQREIRFYTEEQFSALDQLEENPRLLFHGGAGTGKTFLALETARRSSLIGKSVLICCYNQLLGSWLKKEAEPLGEKVVADNLHSLMVQIVGNEVPTEANHDFWSEKLPVRALELLLDGHEMAGRFDTLIIDEAQDLCSDQYLDVLDLLVKGGLKDGIVQVFGDFDFQDIFLNREEKAGRREAIRRRTNAVSFSLKQNCRNRPQIGSVATAVYETSPYQAYRRPDDGVTPKWIVYVDQSSQVEELAGAISALRDEHYQLGDISILSRLNDGAAWHRLPQPFSEWLTPAKNFKAAKIRTSTIQAFKGMESTAVIVCDIDLLSTPEARDLLYIAASRATDKLILLLHESAKNHLLSILVGEKS